MGGGGWRWSWSEVGGDMRGSDEGELRSYEIRGQYREGVYFVYSYVSLGLKV